MKGMGDRSFDAAVLLGQPLKGGDGLFVGQHDGDLPALGGVGRLALRAGFGLHDSGARRSAEGNKPALLFAQHGLLPLGQRDLLLLVARLHGGARRTGRQDGSEQTVTGSVTGLRRHARFDRSGLRPCNGSATPAS